MLPSKYENVQVDPGGYFVFVRFWPDWHGDSDFPFDQFNAIPDDRFLRALEQFVTTDGRCKMKLTEALERRLLMTTHRPNPVVRDIFETVRRGAEIHSWAWGDIQTHAKSLGLSPDKSKPDLVDDILEAEKSELVHMAILRRRKPAHDGDRSLEGRLKKCLAAAPMAAYARAVGWVHRFAVFNEQNPPASRRQVVFYMKQQQEAERLAAALQNRFAGLSPCARFGILSVEDFTPEQQITVQPTIEILCGTDPIPSYVASKLDLPDLLRDVVREASGLAATVAEMKERRQLGDEELPVGSATGSRVERQRGRKGADEATMKKEAELLARWKVARETGKSRKEFTKSEGITVDNLERIRARVKKRKEREKR